MPLRILITTGAEHRQWVTTAVQARSHEYDIAETPAEAWRLLEAKRFDLVLLGKDFPDSKPFSAGMRRRKAKLPLVGLDAEPLVGENLGIAADSFENRHRKLEALLQRHEERRNMVAQSVAVASHTAEQRALSRQLRIANRRLTLLLESSRKMFALDQEDPIWSELLRVTARFSSNANSLVLMERRHGLAVRMGTGIAPAEPGALTVPVPNASWKKTPAFQRLSDPGSDKKVRELLRTNNYCTLPLRAGGRTYGLLVVGCDAKSVDRAALHSAVSTGATAIHAKRRERDLRILAERDGLTRLPNYKALQRILRVELKRHQRTSEPLTVAMLDIDFFKKINDTHGHLTGDKTLRALADLLQRHLRETDTVVRYGGEEFVMVMPITPREGAEKKVTELLSTIRAIDFPKTGPLTLSAGLASFPADGDTPQALLEAADQALYAAKREGRDRAITYHEWLESSLAAEQDGSKELNRDSPGDQP